MKKTTLSSILALTLTLFAFNVNAQTNVLLNGNFETGTVGVAPAGLPLLHLLSSHWA